MSHKIKGFYRFGDFRFDSDRRVLWRDGEMVALTPKASEVLYLLFLERGNLVERQVLIDGVWSDSIVEEGNLNQAISALRKVLGESAIQTVARRGYRFTAEVIEDNGRAEVIIERQTVSTTFIEERAESGDEISVSHPQLTGTTRKGGYLLLGSAAALLLVVTAGVWFLTTRSSSGERVGRSSIRSIAVLPLKSFSSENVDEELRLRITDALITKLGRLDTLVVRPTNSVLRFAREQHDAVDAGKSLGVDAVLDGRVQNENGRLRVTLQFIAVSNGEQLWSEQFDGRVGELLALQDIIATRFRQDFAFANMRDAGSRSAANNASYEAYLKGRFLWNQRKKESYFAALEFFEKSVEIDPNFALGYTGIADCYYLLEQRNVLSTEAAYSKAEVAARKALGLDPNLAEAHTSMGSIALNRYFQWSEAEKYFLHAIELDPNSAETYGRLGMLYNAWARFDEAHAVLRKAESLDPTSLNLAIYLGANYYFSKQFDRAEEQFKRVLEFAPGTPGPRFFLRRIYEITARYDEAVTHALEDRELSGRESVEPLRVAYQQDGIRGFWLKQIETLKAESKGRPGLEYEIASRYALLGDERVCDYIEQNLANLGSFRNYGRVDPIFDRLRAVPRFIDLMRKSAPQA